MSTTDDLGYLEAQRSVVAAQLERLRPEQRLMRINLESRLQLIDEEIAALETVEALDREETYRLFITGTSPGSFSFELEEVANEKQRDPSVLHDAVDQTSLLLQATQLDDESYANAVAESNVRVVKALADFLGLMESRGATLRLSVEERECLFDTPDVVARAAERTRKTNITEAEEQVRGVLSGVFAKGRRFEFQVEESGDVISGRITYDITDPSSLKPHLWTRCLAHMWIVTVERRGEKQRTYYLTNVEPLANDEGG